MRDWRGRGDAAWAWLLESVFPRPIVYRTCSVASDVVVRSSTMLSAASAALKYPVTRSTSASWE